MVSLEKQALVDLIKERLDDSFLQLTHADLMCLLLFFVITIINYYYDTRCIVYTYKIWTRHVVFHSISVYIYMYDCACTNP